MRAEGKGGEGRRSSKKETKKQWKRTRAIFSAASRLIFPPLCMRACVRARTRHGPMTSIHFHARMENSGAGERGMETEGRGRKLTRDKRYFSRRGVKESSLRASFRRSLKKKKKEADELKTNWTLTSMTQLALPSGLFTGIFARTSLFRGMSFITRELAN